MNNPVIRFLKHVNSMPFAFSMKHYQVFGDTTPRMKDQQLTSAESWNALRENHPFFSISADREEWLAASEVEVKKDGQDAQLKERAHDVTEYLRVAGITHVFSVGVGGAALEYQMKKMAPDLSIVCSDYSDVTVARLKKVFLESDGIVQFDIQHGDWKDMQERYIGEHGVCLIYRIDASFSDQEWQAMFAAMAAAGIRHVLVIPTGTLTMLSIYNRKKREIRWHLKHVPIVFSGYLRTRTRFRQQWESAYDDIESAFGGLKGFFLTKRV